MNVIVLLPAALLAIAAAAAPSATLPRPPEAVGDAKHGGQLFLQCRACHNVAASAPSTVGPNLAGVVGAKAASKAGYSYSAALTKSGIVWTPAQLDSFIKRPMAAVPGTKMAFAGVADPKARADIIAYLTMQKAR